MSGKKNHPVRTVINTLFAHVSVIVSLIVLICFVLDKFNDAMDFMTADISRWLIGISALIAIINGILTIVSLWKKPNNKVQFEE